MYNGIAKIDNIREGVSKVCQKNLFSLFQSFSQLILRTYNKLKYSV